MPAEAGWLLAANTPTCCCDRSRIPPEREALDAWRAESGPTFTDDTGMTIIICRIVLGMRFIHLRGVIHRELKPANILIDGRGWPRIGDLGSRPFMDMNVTMTIGVGTRLSMAPEMYENVPYTSAIDLLAFALILCEILVDACIFPPTLAEAVVIKRILDAKRPLLPRGMNSVIKKIITGVWAPEPTTRPSFDNI
jgi:serine/threonine protein kinase